MLILIKIVTIVPNRTNSCVQFGEACCVPRRIRLFQPLNQVMEYR
ncbi:Uncharacterized protein LW93_2450 [Fusarium fujikuroi]|nr:Uncharacterized protein LW93_2450 [Fusarium fujikuroi]